LTLIFDRESCFWQHAEFVLH